MREIIFAGEKDVGLSSIKSLQKHFERIYIHSSSDDNVLNLKRQNDIIINDFGDVDIRYVFLGGYPKFITPDQLLKKTYINIHGALLPRFRGRHSFFWGIMNCEEYLGLTVHLVDKYMDSGDIIYQFKVKYEEQPMYNFFEVLYNLVEEKLGKVVIQYIDGEIIPTKQDKKEALWACRRNLDDCFVDFSISNKLLRRFFLALTSPYPLPRIRVRKKTYEIINYKIIDKDYYIDIGRCLNVDDEGAWIKTKDGFLIVETLIDTETNEIVDPREIISIGYRF